MPNDTDSIIHFVLGFGGERLMWSSHAARSLRGTRESGASSNSLQGPASVGKLTGG